MRSFTFDVLVRSSASGSGRAVEGANWLNLANKLARKGRVRLVQNSKSFAGYGSSYYVGYTRYNYTVTEVPGAFAA